MKLTIKRYCLSNKGASNDNGHLTMEEASDILIDMVARASRHPFAFWFFWLHGMPPADEIVVMNENGTELCKHQTGWLQLRHALCALLKCGKEGRS